MRSSDLRRFIRCFALGPLVALGTMSAAPDAHADPQSEAKDLFARGRELRETNKDCGSAAPLFRKAYKIFPQGLGSLRNLAECEEQLGHFASSRRSWLDLKRALITAPPDSKYDGWDKDSDEAATRLKAKVASFVVDVYVKSPEGEALANDHSGVEIFVNGESVGTTLVGTPLERDPGQYRVRAQAADAPPVEQIVTLGAGDNPHVTIRLVRTPKPVTSAPVQEVKTTQRTVGWIVAGAGAAFLVGGGVTYLIRNGAESELDEQCPSHVNCPESLRDTVDRGDLMSTLTTILLPVGVVGIGAGIALVLTSKGSTSSETPKAARIAPPKKERAPEVRLAPSFGGLGLTGTF